MGTDKRPTQRSDRTVHLRLRITGNEKDRKGGGGRGGGGSDLGHINDPCHFPPCLEVCLTFILNDENVYNRAVKTDFSVQIEADYL